VTFRARLVAAAKSDLAQAVAEKRFREDLYYRLNGVCLKLPPLRARADDIPHLVRHFLNKLNHQRGRVIENLTEEAMDALKRYRWPGNIRELYHQIERIFDLAEPATRVITAAMLSEDIRQAVGARPNSPPTAWSWEGQKMPEVIDAIHKQMITAAMQQANDNVTHAAKILGISRRGLQKMLPRYYHPKSRFLRA
jgi:transcriptional regulator with PAS, ATPase and Fis domain